MKMDELPALGNGEGVELRGPMTFSDASGNYLYAIAASAFTMGEYACVIHGDISTGKIVRKYVR